MTVYYTTQFKLFICVIVTSAALKYLLILFEAVFFSRGLFILFEVKIPNCKMTAGTKSQLYRFSQEESKLMTLFVLQAADASFETLPSQCKEQI